ncbi:hypothetical protein GI364_15650 [Alicyclobacillus sp. SO9]|nr:hypothetical protein GI364_15650 [Alicyclobacillus sp. SO9]
MRRIEVGWSRVEPAWRGLEPRGPGVAWTRRGVGRSRVTRRGPGVAWAGAAWSKIEIPEELIGVLPVNLQQISFSDASILGFQPNFHHRSTNKLV